MTTPEREEVLATATISELSNALRKLDCGVIIWLPGDFPSEEDFDANVDTVVDLCIERGNEAIAHLCGEA